MPTMTALPVLPVKRRPVLKPLIVPQRPKAPEPQFNNADEFDREIGKKLLATPGVSGYGIGFKQQGMRGIAVYLATSQAKSNAIKTLIDSGAKWVDNELQIKKIPVSFERQEYLELSIGQSIKL